MALGGSTNAVLHLPAARRSNVSTSFIEKLVAHGKTRPTRSIGPTPHGTPAAECSQANAVNRRMDHS